MTNGAHKDLWPWTRMILGLVVGFPGYAFSISRQPMLTVWRPARSVSELAISQSFWPIPLPNLISNVQKAARGHGQVGQTMSVEGEFELESDALGEQSISSRSKRKQSTAAFLYASFR